MWAAAEFDALCLVYSHGAAVPYPVQVDGAEILMEFIGEGQTAAPRVAQTIADIDLPGVGPLSASLGIAVYPEHATTPERLERLADAALYTAKRNGRNRVEVASPGPDGLSGDGQPIAIATADNADR